ncbi:MAG: hypothetical protein MJZ04_09925, partial [Bacteroidales bacterium]|nr:hypothetical protein [Bacteroidales bacterium]
PLSDAPIFFAIEAKRPGSGSACAAENRYLLKNDMTKPPCMAKQTDSLGIDMQGGFFVSIMC